MLLLALQENICDPSVYLFFKSRCVLVWIAPLLLGARGGLWEAKWGISFSLPKHGCVTVSPSFFLELSRSYVFFLAQLKQEAAISASVAYRGYWNKTRTQPSSTYNCFNDCVQNRRVLVPQPCHLGSSVLGTICSVLRLVHFLFSSS